MLLTAFFFSGGILIYPPRRTRQKGAKNQAREANGNESDNETRATTPKKRRTGRENTRPLPTTPPKTEMPTRAKNHDLTAHGLKARNGSRTRRTVGVLARSGQERQPKSRTPSTASATILATAPTRENCRGCRRTFPPLQNPPLCAPLCASKL